MGSFYSSEPLSLSHTIADSYDIFNFNAPQRGMGAVGTTESVMPLSRVIDNPSTPALFFYTNSNNLQYGQMGVFATDFRNYSQFGDKSWLNDMCGLFY